MGYAEIFEGARFDTGTETWIATVENNPDVPVQGSDRVCFALRFTPTGRMPGSQERTLKLSASQAGIDEENHESLLHQRVLQWLETTEVDGEVECFG